MPLQRVPINNFRGGLNTRDSPFELMPNESPDLLNVTLSALVGQLQVRQGMTQLGAATVAGNIDYCLECEVNGTPWLMCSINGAVYAISSTGASTLLFTGTAGTIWDFAVMPDAAQIDHVWYMNGVDAPRKWTGTGADAAWAGAPPNGNILQVWKNRMCVAGAPTKNAVYFSPISLGTPIDPENTSGNGWDELIFTSQTDEAEAITELNIFADRLFCFKRRSVFYVSDPATLANKRIGEPGCYGRFQSAAVTTEAKLYFFNEQGVWSTAGVEIAYEAGSINNWFPQNLTMSALAQVRMISTKDSYPRVLVAMPTNGSNTNNILLEILPLMNFRRIGGRRYLLLPAFMLHSFGITAMANFEVSNTWQIVGTIAGNTKLYQFFNGTTDDGAQINAHWRSAWMAIEGEEPFERVRRLNIELSGSATVEVWGDFRSTPDFSATVPVSPAGWDPGHISAQWDDNFVWDDGQSWDPVQYRFARLRPESRARFHQINVKSGLVPYKVNVIELAIRGGKEH